MLKTIHVKKCCVEVSYIFSNGVNEDCNHPIRPLAWVLYVFKTIHVKSVMWKFPASFLTGQAKKHEEKE
jgi:hypothetical protein